MRSDLTTPVNPALLQRALQGDPEAFWKLVEPYQKVVYSVALGVMRDPEKAEDVAQDTFVRAFSTLGNLRSAPKLGGWLYSMAKNISYEHLRKSERQAKIAASNPGPTVIPVSDLMMKEEELGQLDRALAELPDAHRIVLGLKYMNNLSCKEIAETLGCGLEAAKSRLFEARRALRARMVAAENATHPASHGRSVQNAELTAEKKVL